MTAWNDNGNHCWEEGSSNVREHDCCSGATEAAYEPPWSRESEGAGAAIGFLCGWDRKRRHHTPSCAVTQPSQNSQVVILVFRNANLLILVSFWSFLPCCAYLKLTSPSSVSGLPHAQEFPLCPHSLKDPPKEQLGSIIIFLKVTASWRTGSPFLDDETEVYRCKETRCGHTTS